MATIKSYTDIPQSKKLAEILPITSIDFAWNIFSDGSTRLLPMDDWQVSENAKSNVEIIPCWSLAALLNILPVSCDDGQHCLALINHNPNEKTEWLCAYEDDKGNLMMECYADSQIDACVEMILKLHERKML